MGKWSNLDLDKFLWLLIFEWNWSITCSGLQPPTDFEIACTKVIHRGKTLVWTDFYGNIHLPNITHFYVKKFLVTQRLSSPLSQNTVLYLYCYWLSKRCWRSFDERLKQASQGTDYISGKGHYWCTCWRNCNLRFGIWHGDVINHCIPASRNFSLQSQNNNANHGLTTLN